MPHADDKPALCASKVLSEAKFAANHSNYHAVLAYGDRTAGMKDYNDTIAAGIVAAFMLVFFLFYLFEFDCTR